MEKLRIHSNALRVYSNVIGLSQRRKVKRLTVERIAQDTNFIPQSDDANRFPKKKKKKNKVLLNQAFWMELENTIP